MEAHGRTPRGPSACRTRTLQGAALDKGAVEWQRRRDGVQRRRQVHDAIQGKTRRLHPPAVLAPLAAAVPVVRWRLFRRGDGRGRGSGSDGAGRVHFGGLHTRLVGPRRLNRFQRRRLRKLRRLVELNARRRCGIDRPANNLRNAHRDSIISTASVSKLRAAAPATSLAAAAAAARSGPPLARFIEWLVRTGAGANAVNRSRCAAPAATAGATPALTPLPTVPQPVPPAGAVPPAAARRGRALPAALDQKWLRPCRPPIRPRGLRLRQHIRASVPSAHALLNWRRCR